MPYYRYIGKNVARHFDRAPFYLYLRPFVFGFLNSLANEYELAVYSRIEKKLLIFLLDIIQEEKEYFTISISHNVKGKPKILSKFFTEGRSEKNVMLIDSNPKTMAANYSNCIPIHPFEGERLDSNLLYLQKYLLELNKEPDLNHRLAIDFKINE